jgi:hypothetical protein
VFWIILLGCAGVDDSGETTPPPPPPGEFGYMLSVDSLAFGGRDLGALSELTITVNNTGGTDLLFLEVVGGEIVELSNPASPILFPGESTELTVTWTPEYTGDLIDQVSIVIGESPAAPETVVFPVTGMGQGAVLQVSTTEYSFGSVPVGCNETFDVTLSNIGNEDMEVTALDLAGADSFMMFDPPDLPFTLAPLSSQEFSVMFSPQERNTATSVVSIESTVDDTFVTLEGVGLVDSENLLEFTVGERSKSTILIHANECVIEGPYGTYAARLEASLPVFFQSLIDNGSEFRVAFVWNQNGTVSGDIPYIDDSYTAEEATAIALAMIAPGANAGDNDRSYTTLENAMVQQSDWLFEDDGWSASKLSLMAFNRDQEQSGGQPSTFIATAQSYKEDTDNLVYHALAGPPPNGCGTAESFVVFKTAVDDTGGVFVSICEPDYDTNMTKLVGGAVVGAEYFAMTGTPLVSSIQVRIDDVRTTVGWSYDSDLNAVVFEDDYYPGQGAVVEIYYLKSDACG